MVGAVQAVLGFDFVAVDVAAVATLDCFEVRDFLASRVVLSSAALGEFGRFGCDDLLEM